MADRYSVCQGEVGRPDGDLVIEAMIDGTFTEYNVTLRSGYPTQAATKCGTEKTLEFYFEDPTALDNLQLRCVVKNSGAFIGEELPISDSQTLHVIPSM